MSKMFQQFGNNVFQIQFYYIKAFCKHFGSFFYHKHDLKTKKCEDYFQILSGLPCKSLVWESQNTVDEDQKAQIRSMLNEKSKSCKIAYLTAKFCQEKDIDIPQNYPFIILEAADLQVQAQSSQTLTEHLFIIMKSVDPNFSKIKIKSQDKFKKNSSATLAKKLEHYRNIPDVCHYSSNVKDLYNRTQYDFDDYKNKIKNSVFAIDFETFCEKFGTMYQLVGVNQNFQSSTENIEKINVQQSENRYFFSFSLNLPAKILINVEQNIEKLGQLLPVRIVLAQDKMGIISSQKKTDPLQNDNNDIISRNKKDVIYVYSKIQTNEIIIIIKFLRRKFIKKVKVKKQLEPKKKDNVKGKSEKEKSENQEQGGEEGKKEKSQKSKNDDDNENKMYQKKKYQQFKYIFGKGQYKKKNIFKTISLDEGNYILMVQMEGPDLKILSEKNSALNDTILLNLVVSIFGDNLINIQRIEQPENFIRQVYEACIHQAQKRHILNSQKQLKDQVSDVHFQKSDLGDRENGSDQIIICQYFLHEEGTYLQLLDNKTDNKSWRQKLYFITENMKIFESNENNKVDVFLNPHSEQLIIIQQVKGGVYNLEGGEGICLIENIQKGAESDEGEDNDDA